MKRSIKSLLATLVVSLSLAAPVLAGQLEDGVAAERHGAALLAERQGDYASALRLWRRLAEQGFAGAQYNLGLLYVTGRGVAQDNAKAVKWYRKAAEQGVAAAQHNLGVMYEKGLGVPQDNAAAVK